MEKKNFYNEMLEKISLLIKEKKYNEALDLINQELSMPYVPTAIEEKLQDLKTKALINITPKNQIINVSLQEVEEILFKDGDLNNIMSLVQKIKKLNISQYLDLLSKYLILPEGDDVAKSIIIFTLKESKIGGPFKVVKHNQEIEFEPSKLIETNNEKSFGVGQEIINDAFKQEVSKLNLAEQIYFTTLFSQAPFAYDDEFAKDTALKAIESVNKAFK